MSLDCQSPEILAILEKKQQKKALTKHESRLYTEYNRQLALKEWENVRELAMKEWQAYPTRRHWLSLKGKTAINDVLLMSWWNSIGKARCEYKLYAKERVKCTLTKAEQSKNRQRVRMKQQEKEIVKSVEKILEVNGVDVAAVKAAGGELVHRLNSVYKPEYVQKLMDMRKEGKTIENFCAEVGISRTAYDGWLDKYPLFKEAADLGETMFQSWFQEKAIAYGMGDRPYVGEKAIFKMVALNTANWKGGDVAEKGGGTSFVINISTDFKEEPSIKVVEGE